MRCRNCGHVNPEENNYCGKCGKLLLPAFSEIREAVLARRPAAAEATPRPEPVLPVPPKDARITSKATSEEYALAEEAEFGEEAPKRAPAASSPSLGGPSFLGLSGPTEDGSFTYLLEDEEPRSHTGRRILLVLLAVAVGVAAWQWRSVSDFVIVTVMPYLQGAVASGAKPPAAAGPNSSTSAPDAAQPTSAEVAEAPASANAPDGVAPVANSEDSKDSTQSASANPSASQDQATQAGTPKPPEQPQAGENQQKKQAEAAGAEIPAKPARNARKTHTPAADQSASLAQEKQPQAPAPPVEDRESENLLARGEKYLYGRGAPRDCQRALIYMQAAAQKDNAGALSHLGAMYSTGECVPLDRAKAYGFFSRALQLDRSNTYLERNLTILWREMSDTERQNILRTRRQ